MSALRLFDKFQKLLDVTWGSIADGQTLKRSGSNIIGYTPGGGSGDVVGPASAVSGNVASYSGTTGKLIADGGKLVADVVTGPASATTGRIATYNGATGKIIQDGAKLGADLVTGPASATTGRIASYGDTTGKVIADGAKLASDLVVGPASSVDSEVALFSGAGGKTIQRATGTGLVNVSSGVYQTPLVVANIAPPVGSVTDFAGSTAPAGWELCYGQSLLRAGTYAALFAIIGTTYGSVDGTHFTLPDCRGRTVAGKDDMGGIAASRLTSTYFANASVLGAVGGGESHVLTTAQLAAHNHTMNNMLVFNSGSGIASGTGYQFTNANTLDQGLSNAHPNVQPTIVFNKIIKY